MEDRTDMRSPFTTRRPQTSGVVYPAFVPRCAQANDADDAAAVAPKAAADAAAAAAAGGWKPPATQAELDQIIENRLARERAANRRELDRIKAEAGGQTPEELRELETLRREKADRERKALEDKGNYDRAIDSIRKEHDAEKLKIAADKDALFKELKQTRCHDALLAEASVANAINPTQVARLLADNVQLNDERRVVVLDDEGQPWLKNGKNIAIKDLIEKFAHDNAHLFKAPTSGTGSGSKGGSSTDDDSGATSIDAQIDAAEKEYEAAHKEAAATGAVPDMDKARLARRKVEALKNEKKKKAGAAA